ncbi:MAG TPA: peptidylprolyl isomerase [Actinomycetota bacterium]|nr:peptidylprolyl isomerase [Actinomycetota bacterium]
MSPSRVARVLIVVLLTAACGAGRPEVARVGDREVEETDLAQAVALQRVLADLQGVPCGQAQEGEREAAACDRTALSAELLWLAIVGYAEANDLVAAASDVDEAVSQLETQVGADALDEALEKRGLTRDDLVELGRRILTLRAVRDAVAEESVGEDELRAQYDKRMNEFTTVQADHILLGSQAEAERVYRRVRDASEQEFVDVAKQTSSEPGAAERGGRLGSAVASTYVPEFAEAVVALEPGEISRPVRTQFGWHVIYLVDKEIASFEEAKASILEPLADREFRSWLEERAEELDVEVDPRYGRFDPTTFSVSASRSTDPDAVSPSPATP